MNEVIFLKLGGSLITDKTQPYTSRPDMLAQVAGEIRLAISDKPGLRLVLGHGSGSFGHFAAKAHMVPYPPLAGEGTGDMAAFWRGYAEVWYRASQLNRYVVEALHTAGVPAISISPSALVEAENGAIVSWDLRSLNRALEVGLVPVIYGDIVFDALKGSVILSTETLMFYLAHRLRPKSILLAGLEQAVWADFPARRQPVEKMTPSVQASMTGQIGGSHGADVTGGMRSKVEEMLLLVQQVPNLAVRIFSGEQPGNIRGALRGEPLGTLIAND